MPIGLFAPNLLHTHNNGGDIIGTTVLVCSFDQVIDTFLGHKLVDDLLQVIITHKSR